MVCMRVWRGRYFPLGLSITQLKKNIGSDESAHTLFEGRVKEARDSFIAAGGLDMSIDWDDVDRKVALAFKDTHVLFEV